MVHEWSGHLEILSPSQATENARPYLLLGHFTENSRWVPLILRQCFIFQDYYNQLFGIKTITSSSISQALCLPVSVSELVEVNQSDRVSSVLVVFVITFCF